MFLKIRFGVFVCLFLGGISYTASSQDVVENSKASLQSPDKKIIIKTYQKVKQGKRVLYYTVAYNNKQVIQESALDIQLDNNLSEKAMALPVDKHEKWCENLQIRRIISSTKDTTWVPTYGEEKNIRDYYHAMTLELIKEDNPVYVMQVEIRAYNTGAALRYYFPENQKGTYYHVTSENTEFKMPEGTQAWFANWAQAPYRKLPLKDWPGESERPLTLELPNGLYVNLAEAQMTDYARTKFKLSAVKPSTILTAIDGDVALISPVGSPWRVIMIAERPGDLIQNNSIILNLNQQSRVADDNWIKPGKIMRVMNQTTVDAKANIDFAVQQKMQYILFDWKWYGPAFSFSSDASKVAIKDFDLPGIIQYGKERGVGVWLYVNQQALLAQSDSLFSIYRKWGIKGVKFGFVQVGTHRWTTWIEKTIQQAAENQIMVNIHDDWRPTGEQRTWPNLMTSEGVRGNEEMPDATHNTVLPFTRYIAGAADYTICYFDKRIKTTHAHQLALAAIYYSPLQTLFWYDKPGQYHHEPELDFWKKIPTSWDETRVLQGLPGEYIATARRSGDNWFIGTITNNNSRKVKLSFGFLPVGKRYKATVYSDDDSVTTATHVKVEHLSITNSTILNTQLKASGGQAIHLQAIN